MPVFSIICPVYNAVPYLCRCIESVIAQTFTDWELLLVDDGSSDNSGKVCDTFSARDSRIKVIHKQNGGVSSARNIGIDVAVGTWIAFIDADDWVEDNWLSVISSSLRTPEMLLGYSYKRVSPNFSAVKKMSISKSIDDINIYRDIPHMVWAYVFNRSVIDRIKLRFPLGVKYSEDQYFIYMYISFVENIHIVDSILYNYNETLDSAVTKFSVERYVCNLKVASLLLDSLQDKNNQSKDFIEKSIIYMLRYFLVYAARSKYTKELDRFYAQYYDAFRKINPHLLKKFDLRLARFMPFLNLYKYKVTRRLSIITLKLFNG